MKEILLILFLFSMSEARSRHNRGNESDASSEPVPDMAPTLNTEDANKLLSDFEQRYQDRSFEIIVAEELLSAIDAIVLESYAKFENTGSNIMAGDSLKICLYVFMGYHGREQCLKRGACEAGELIGRLSDSSSLALAALYYVTPKDWKNMMDMVQKGATGKNCYTYRCGRPLRSETDPRIKELASGKLFL
ncbi:hypothetical protein SK128_014420 [Halocaridina rubra]|uniref:Uncharacterized protein n=1 Tax=Halocaridina rubra TaxID=373956 RepID=A0AAN8XGM4_HALRR